MYVLNKDAVVCSKNYCPNSCCRSSNIRQSIIGCREASSTKCVTSSYTQYHVEPIFILLDAKHRPEGGIGGADISGIRNATSGSITDKLTREHRMTLDEARLILNVKKEEPLEKILQVC